MYKSRQETYDAGMARISSSEARQALPEVIALAQHEAVTIERHNRAVAVVLSPERHAELLEAWEEAQDVAAFDEAIAEAGDDIPWDQVKADLGWT